MKQIVLAAMTVLTLVGPANANGWDYFWGTTLNPANTGWNDFWYQCQDPNKDANACAGVVFAGIGMVLGGAIIGTVGTVMGAGALATLGPATAATTAVVGMAPTTVITYGPAGATTALFGTAATLI